MEPRREIFPHVIEMNYQARRRLGCCVYLVFDDSLNWLLIDIGYEDTVAEIVERLGNFWRTSPERKAVGLGIRLSYKLNAHRRRHGNGLTDELKSSRILIDAECGNRVCGLICG